VSTKYVLDTQLYIAAYRNQDRAHELERFLARHLPRTYLSAVVALEFLAGARSRERRREIREGILAPFERTGRIITPSPRTWQRGGEVLSKLAASGERPVTSESFTNDVLLALSAAEHGVTVVTENIRDFELIEKAAPVRFVPPWPK
jgi:predicted nucleic acid-binding protein